jgi:hypothetical protein
VKEIRDFRVTGNGSRPNETRLTALPNFYAAAVSGARAMSLAFLYLDRNQSRVKAANRPLRWHGGEGVRLTAAPAYFEAGHKPQKVWRHLLCFRPSPLPFVALDPAP